MAALYLGIEPLEFQKSSRIGLDVKLRKVLLYGSGALVDRQTLTEFVLQELPRPPVILIKQFTILFDLACRSQISSGPTAFLPTLIITKDVQSSWAYTAPVLVHLIFLPEDYDKFKECHQNTMAFLNTLLHDGFTIGEFFWEFLNDDKRCGSLYRDRVNCYTQITKSWLQLLAGSLRHRVPR